MIVMPRFRSSSSSSRRVYVPIRYGFTEPTRFFCLCSGIIAVAVVSYHSPFSSPFSSLFSILHSPPRL